MTSRLDRLRATVGRWAAEAVKKREEREESQAADETVPGPAGAPGHPEGGPGAAPGAANPSVPPSVPAPPHYAPAVVAKPEPSAAVPWGVRVAAEAGWRLLVLAGVIWVLMQIVSAISLLIIAFSAGLLITALLQPTVARLRRIGLGRGFATAVTFITGFVVMGLVGWFVVWQVLENLDTLTSRVQAGIDELKSWAVNGPFHVSEEQINGMADNLSNWIGDNTNEITSAGLEGVTVLFEFLSGMLLAMFVTLFLLYDGRRIWNWALKFVPASAREGVAGAGPRAWQTLTGYVRGTVIVALIDAVFIGVGLQLLDVPLAVPLAVFIFLFAFIPIVGAVISGALAVLVALVTNDFVTSMLVLAVVLAVQQIESHVLQPFILGRLVRVHPLAVVLAVTGGGLIAGIPGAVVSVPLVAVTNSVVVYLRAYAAESAAAAVAAANPPGQVGAEGHAGPAAATAPSGPGSTANAGSGQAGSPGAEGSDPAGGSPPGSPDTSARGTDGSGGGSGAGPRTG